MLLCVGNFRVRRSTLVAKRNPVRSMRTPCRAARLGAPLSLRLSLRLSRRVLHSYASHLCLGDVLLVRGIEALLLLA